MSLFCSFSCLVSKDSQHVILTSFWHFGVSRTDDDPGTLSTMLDYEVSILPAHKASKRKFVPIGALVFNRFA